MANGESRMSICKFLKKLFVCNSSMDEESVCNKKDLGGGGSLYRFEI